MLPDRFAGISIIDTMIGFPHGDMKETYKFITDQTKDRQSKDEFEFPAEYMFKNVPEKELRGSLDPVATTVWPKFLHDNAARILKLDHPPTEPPRGDAS